MIRDVDFVIRFITNGFYAYCHLETCWVVKIFWSLIERKWTHFTKLLTNIDKYEITPNVFENYFEVTTSFLTDKAKLLQSLIFLSSQYLALKQSWDIRD